MQMKGKKCRIYRMRDGKRITPDGRKNINIGINEGGCQIWTRYVWLLRMTIYSSGTWSPSICRQQNGIEVVGAAGDGVETLRLVTECEPDVLVCDLIMPQMDGYGGA